MFTAAGLQIQSNKDADWIITPAAVNKGGDVQYLIVLVDFIIRIV